VTHVATYGANGQRLATYDHSGRLQFVTIDQPTSRYSGKLIIAGVDDRAGASFGIAQPLAMIAELDANGKRIWEVVLLPPSVRIARLGGIDHDNDAKRELSVTTAAGDTIYIGFDGQVQGKSSPRVEVKLLPRKVRDNR
jgi:hypothetical protein